MVSDFVSHHCNRRIGRRSKKCLIRPCCSRPEASSSFVSSFRSSPCHGSNASANASSFPARVCRLPSQQQLPSCKCEGASSTAVGACRNAKGQMCGHTRSRGRKVRDNTAGCALRLCRLRHTKVSCVERHKTRGRVQSCRNNADHPRLPADATPFRFTVPPITSATAGGICRSMRRPRVPSGCSLMVPQENVSLLLSSLSVLSHCVRYDAVPHRK